MDDPSHGAGSARRRSGRYGGGAGGAVAADPMQITSIFDFVIKGGWTMVPIGLCSLMALTIIVERALMVRRRRVVPPRFVAELQAAVGDRQRTQEVCRAISEPDRHGDFGRPAPAERLGRAPRKGDGGGGHA